MITNDVSPEAAPWRFKPADKALAAAYEAGFSVVDLFSPNGRPAPGIVTTQDEFAISWSAAEAAAKVERLLNTANESEARQLFRLCSQSQWNYAAAKSALADGAWRKEITPIAYRPFDTRHTGYNSHVAVHRRDRVMRHFLCGPNIGGAFTRTIEGDRAFGDFLAFDLPITHHTLSIKEVNSLAPLYLYPEEGTLDQTIRVNFEPKLYAKIREAAGLTDTQTPPDASAIESGAFRHATGNQRPDEVKIFDYIYGVLHSPAYRTTYAEFLKIDFPRVPFPASPETFAQISAHGEALRRLHLMEPAAIGPSPTFPFEGEGDSLVDKPRYEAGKVWINPTQAFAGVSDTAWNFHIGGYQPAQKWLKDRKGRQLTYDDIRHYQRIIKILDETMRIMGEITLPLA